MLQAIRTKYLAPTNTKGPRVKATCLGGSVTLAWEYALDQDANHTLAATLLCKKLEWDVYPIGGVLADGDYAFVLWVPSV